ncbi:ArnT family glycosyltransferase [Elusimicrobiota bacterium]
MNKKKAAISILIFLGSFILFWSTRDIPVVWDESHYASAGIKYWEAISDLDIDNDVWILNKEHPPLVKYLAGMGWLVFKEPRFGNCLLSAFGLMCLFLLCSRWGTIAGIAAVAAAVAQPRLFTHSHYVELDAPLAWTWICTLFIALELMDRPSVSMLLLFMIALGVSLLVKINAILIPVPVIAAALLYRRSAAGWVIGGTAGGAFLFLLGWPWLWTDTVSRLVKFFTFFSGHSQVSFYYFGNASADISRLPWHYVIVMTLGVLPLTVFFLALFGLVRGLVKKDHGIFLIVCSLVISTFPFLFPFVVKYNGVRLFLVNSVLIAALAGIGIGYLAGRCRRCALAALAVLLIHGLIANISVYPYGLIYYGGMLGGTRGAVSLGMQTSYWGETAVAAADYINRTAPPDSLIVLPRGPNIQAGRDELLISPYFRADIRTTRDRQLRSRKDIIYIRDAREASFDTVDWNLWKNCTPHFEKIVAGVPVVRVYSSEQVLSCINDKD